MTDSRTDDATRKLLISFHPNPRVVPLVDGGVKPEGVDLEWDTGEIGASDVEVDAAPGIRRFPVEQWIEVLAAVQRAIGITPVNHTLIVQKRLLVDRPDLATRMLQAFERSKFEAYRRSPTARAILPECDLDAQRRAFGDDPFPYGLKANRQVLELVAEQLEIDGIIRKRPDIDGLVADSVRGS